MEKHPPTGRVLFIRFLLLPTLSGIDFRSASKILLTLREVLLSFFSPTDYTLSFFQKVILQNLIQVADDNRGDLLTFTNCRKSVSVSGNETTQAQNSQKSLSTLVDLSGFKISCQLTDMNVYWVFGALNESKSGYLVIRKQFNRLQVISL
ncbi:hypothetical protein [Algoriphagus sp.]|uniref:hypothetical protein n=1 Tax=Algoriphagus sp. TaxID=1872435 RepID=UPI003272D2E8